MYGKNTEGNLVRLEDLEQLEGEVVVRGCVQSMEERQIPNKDKYIW